MPILHTKSRAFNSHAESPKLYNSYFMALIQRCLEHRPDSGKLKVGRREEEGLQAQYRPRETPRHGFLQGARRALQAPGSLPPDASTGTPLQSLPPAEWALTPTSPLTSVQHLGPGRVWGSPVRHLPFSGTHHSNIRETGALQGCLNLCVRTCLGPGSRANSTHCWLSVWWCRQPGRDRADSGHSVPPKVP